MNLAPLHPQNPLSTRCLHQVVSRLQSLQKQETSAEMIDQSTHSNPDETLNWLSFPACLCATGTRGSSLRL